MKYFLNNKKIINKNFIDICSKRWKVNKSLYCKNTSDIKSTNNN